MKIYKARNYFHEGLEFAVRHETDLAADFNAGQRFKREFWKITYIVKGSGRVIINNRAYAIGDGSIFLIHPDSETTYDMDSDSLDLYNILFSLRFVENELRTLQDACQFFAIFSTAFRQETNASIYVQRSTPSVKHRIHEISDEFEARRLNRSAYLKFSLALLIIQMFRESDRTFHGSSAKTIIPDYVLHLLRSDLCADTGAAHLAKNFGITPNHLCTLFRKTTGMSISEARLKARLEAAATLLGNPALSLSDVCFRCGFNDLSYFHRAFRKNFGESPRKFRKHGLD